MIDFFAPLRYLASFLRYGSQRGTKMLDNELLESIYNGLKSTDKTEILDACEKVSANIKAMDPKELASITDGLVSLLYIDLDTEPELEGVIDCAIEAISAIGADSVEVLIEGLTDADLEANLRIAHALGKIGQPAIAILTQKFRTDPDPYIRALALFAISKIDDPRLIEIFPEVVSALDHENQELRSMAVQAIGRMVECIGGVCFTAETAAEAFNKLMAKAGDAHAGTRAKAIFSIGKLAHKEYLNDDQKQKALDVISGMLGIDDMHSWDRAFIVRKEAEEAYEHITGRKPGAEDTCKFIRE